MATRKRSRSVGSDDYSGQRAESSSEDDDLEEEKESDDHEEGEEEELADEGERSSESGTDESEVGAASSSSAGSEEDEDEEEDDDVSDTDAEAEQGDHHHHKTKTHIPRSVFLKTTTHKATLQPRERDDCPVPARFPQKPMVEMEPNSNVWYQAYIMKESANEVKVRLPGFGKGKVDKIEWLKKSSSRVWTGSYKSGDWKHLGKGAWEPRTKAAGSRQAAARSGSAGPAGSAGRGRARGRKYRRESASGTPEVSSEGDGNEAYPRRGAQQQRNRSHSPASKGKPASRQQGSKARAAEGSHDGLRRMVVTKRKGEQQLSGGPEGEEEVVSPRPSHAAASAADRDAREHVLDRQRPTGGHSQQRQQSHQQEQQRQQRQPAADEHHSEGEHYWSTHSPNVAESPVVFADQNSSRSSLDQGAAHNAQAQDPDYDPLRKWFEVHFQKLQAAGKLCSLPIGMCESGLLPDGFTLDAAQGIVLSSSATAATAAAGAGAAPGNSNAKLSVVSVAAAGASAAGNAAAKPPATAARQQPGTSPSAPAMDKAAGAAAAGANGTGVLGAPRSQQGSPQGLQGQGQGQGPPKKKRLREPGSDPHQATDRNDPDSGGSADGGASKRPVKHILVKQVPPQPVVPGPAASVDEQAADGVAAGSAAPVATDGHSGKLGSAAEVSPSSQKGRDAGESKPPAGSGGGTKERDREAGLGGSAKAEGATAQPGRQHATGGSGSGAAPRSSAPASLGAAAAEASAPGPTSTGTAAGATPSQAAVQGASGSAPKEGGAVGAGQAAAGSQKSGSQAHLATTVPPPHKPISKHPSKDRLGRRIVMSESSDEDDDRLSPRQPVASIAAAAPAAAGAGPGAGAGAGAGTGSAAGMAPSTTPPPSLPPPPPPHGGTGPSSSSGPAQGACAGTAGNGTPAAAVAAAAPGSTAGLSSAQAKCSKDAGGLGPKVQQSSGRSLGPGSSKEGTPAPVGGPASSGLSSGQQRTDKGSSEGGRPPTGTQEHGRSTTSSGAEAGRARGGEGAGDDVQRGAKPGGGAQGGAPVARPGSPLVAPAASKPEVRPQHQPLKAPEPDRVKGPPVLATDDIEF